MMNVAFLWFGFSVCGSAMTTIQAVASGGGAATVAHNPSRFSETIADEEFYHQPDAETAERIERLVRQLGDPDYSEREKASAGLIELSAPAFGKLHETYLNSDDLEVRLRISAIFRQIFLNRAVYDKLGFLGISMRPYTAADDKMPKLPEGRVGIHLDRIMAGTPAESAGLMTGDVVIAVDAEPLKGTGIELTNSFSTSIRARPPGTKMSFTLIRGAHEISVHVTIGRCPEDYVAQVTGIKDSLFEAQQHFDSWWDKRFRGAEIRQR